MKNLLLIVLLSSIYSLSVNAQVYYTMTFMVVNEFGEPIKDATISIRELGYQSAKSGSDGKAHFSDVPVGEINYFIICDGYIGTDGNFNITTIDKNNTKRISLNTIPDPESNVLLVSGEIVDGQNNDIEGAEIELSAGSYTTSTSSDHSGRYSIEFNLDNIKFNINQLELEVKKDNCKTEEVFEIPKNNHIRKNISLTCVGFDSSVSAGLDKERELARISTFFDRVSSVEIRGMLELDPEVFNDVYADEALLEAKEGVSAIRELVIRIASQNGISPKEAFSMFRIQMTVNDYTVYAHDAKIYIVGGIPKAKVKTSNRMVINVMESEGNKCLARLIFDEIVNMNFLEKRNSQWKVVASQTIRESEMRTVSPCKL